MQWLKLDNTAKIYPLLQTGDNQNMFRANVELYENVIPEVLLRAVRQVVPRFPMLTMELKRGFFWHYLERNPTLVDIYPETPIIMDTIDQDHLGGHNFRVMYFAKRISIDFFHILCDGGAAVEFFKCIIFQYIFLLGKDIERDKSIIDISTRASSAEIEDSFSANYERVKLKDLKVKDLQGTPSYHIEGTPFRVGKGVTTLTLNSNAMLALAKSYKASVTEFISALLVESVHSTASSGAPLKNNFCLFLPINIRRFYNSRSMRNFSLFARANIDISQPTFDFVRCISTINSALSYGTDKTVLDNRINTTVRPSDFLPMRLLPISLKSFIFNIGNRIFGKAKKSASISNLGVLNIPCLEPFVDKFHYQLNTNSLIPLNVACSTFKTKLTISFLRNIIDKEIISTFTKKLIALGLAVTVESNDWEDLHEV